MVSVARDVGALGGAITGSQKIIEFLTKHKDTVTNILSDVKDLILALLGG